MGLPRGFYEAAHQFGWWLSPDGRGFLTGSPFLNDNWNNPEWPVFLRLKTVPRVWGQLPPMNDQLQRLPRDVWYGGPMPRKDVHAWVYVFQEWALPKGLWTLWEVVPIAPEFRGYSWPTRTFHWYQATETQYPGRYQYVMSPVGSQPGAGWYKVA